MADKKISELTNITGSTIADTDEFVVVDASANETKAITAAELRTAIGNGDFTVTGNLTVQGTTITVDSASAQNIVLGDNDKMTFGDSVGGDLQIYHDGEHSFISDVGTGNLKLTTSGNAVIVADSSDSPLANFNQASGEVYLYNISGGTSTTRLTTTSTGVDISGTLTSDGLTVDGTSSIDSIYTGTSSAGVGGAFRAVTNDGAATGSGDRIGYLLFGGAYDASNNIGYNASINAITTQAYTASARGTKLEFQTTANNSTSRLKRQTIENNGDISFYEDTGTTAKFFWDASAESLGIGTSSPTQALHVNAGTTNEVARFESTDGTAYLSIMDNTTSNSLQGIGSAGDNLTLYANNGERMRIDSSGNVIVNNSGSGNGILKVNGATGNTEAVIFQRGGTEASRIGHANSADLTFSTGSSATERMRITSSGSVGIGVVPEAWSTTFTVLDIGSGGASVGSSGGSDARILANAYFDTGGSWRYSSSNYASYYRQVSGTHQWGYAASGTADAALSWSEAMRIDSSGNVGIGTTSPTAVAANYTTLHLDGSSGSSIHLTKTTSGTTATDGSHLINAGGDFYLYHYEGGNIVFSSGASVTERMRISSDGSVGIGTSSPKTELNIAANNSGQGAKLTLENADTSITTNDMIGQIDFYANDGSTNGTGAKVNIKAIAASSAGSLAALTFGTSDSTSATAVERMRIDATGNVGIGTSSPSGILQLQASNPDIYITSADTGQSDIYFGGATSPTKGRIQYSDNSDLMAFWTNSTERMRIDSSGNLLVGKTSADNGATAGAEINSNDTAYFTRSEGAGVVVNRTTSDGNIAVFQKDGATVGSIGTTGGYMYAGSGNTYLYYDDTNNIVRPSNSAGAARDNIVGLGNASNRFTNLYLSGGLRGDTTFKNSAGTTEYARFDSSGNLLVGKTSSASFGTDGIEIDGSNDRVWITRNGGSPLALNRRTSDGDIATFHKDGSTVGSIGVGGSTAQPIIGSGNTVSGGTAAGLRFDRANNAIEPWNVVTNAAADNIIDLGFSSIRFDDIYATNGTIQTSDANEKQDIDVLSDAEQRVALAAKGLLRKFRWKDAVAEKGDDARIHFGIIAQDLQAAFAAEGLDAGDYAMFIHSTWTDEETGEEKSRMGVRYSELLAFIIAAI